MSKTTIPIKYAMISQPMQGLSDEAILEVRKAAEEYLKTQGYTVLDTLCISEATNDFVHPTSRALYCLGWAIKAMGICDAVYFCNGWEQDRGCRVEHETAATYGLKILYESNEEMKGYV